MFNFLLTCRGINYEEKFQEAGGSELHEVMGNIKAVMGKISYFVSRLTKVMQTFENVNNLMKYEDVSEDLKNFKEMLSKSVRVIYGECHQATDNTEDILKDINTLAMDISVIKETQKTILFKIEKLENGGFSNNSTQNGGNYNSNNNHSNANHANSDMQLRAQIAEIQNTLQENLRNQSTNLQTILENNIRNQNTVLVKTIEELRNAKNSGGGNFDQEAFMQQLEKNLMHKIDQIVEARVNQILVRLINEINVKNEQTKKSVEELINIINILVKSSSQNSSPA